MAKILCRRCSLLIPSLKVSRTVLHCRLITSSLCQFRLKAHGTCREGRRRRTSETRYYQFDNLAKNKFSKLLKSKNGAFLCYGERPMYPFDTPFDFLGNRIVPIRGTPNCSPANYHPLQKNIAYDSKHFQCSTKGYSCRARTESRFR